MLKGMSEVISNYFYLLLLQIGNYVVPLVLMPFLVIKLGVYHFGLLSLALAVNMFLRAFTSYGFDLTGVKDVRECLNKSENASNTFCEIMSAKAFIFIISIILMLTFILLVDGDALFYNLCVLYTIVVLGEIIFPVWFYQGMQDMKVIAFLKLLSRFSFVTICIFCINGPEDIYIVPISEGVAALIVGVISIWLAHQRHGIRFLLPNFSSIKAKLKSSWDVFISKIAVLFYTSFNTIVLGVVGGPTVVGFYSIAERIYMALREVFTPVIQALYPFLIDKYSQSKERFNYYSKCILLLLFFMLSLASVLLFYFSDSILHFLTDGDVTISKQVINVFCLCLPFSLGSFFSTLLVISNKAKTLSKITFITMVFNLVLVLPFTYIGGAVGLALCFLIVQMMHFLMQIYYNSEVLK